MTTRTRTMLFAMVALTACRADAPADDHVATLVGASNGIVPDTVFVSADWLAGRLHDAGITILFVGPAEDFDERIPGARQLDVAALNQERDGVPGMLRPVQQLAQHFAALGVSPDQRVVVYGAPLPAARALMALDRLGHDRASLLDGGMHAWRTAGGEIESGAAAIMTPPDGDAARFDADDDLVVDAAWVSDRLDDPNYLLIDARPPAQHSGEEAGDGVPRAGRIPGSVNLFWEELIVSPTEPTLRDEARLRALFEDAGASNEHSLVVYCRTGMQSSFAYAVARHLGYDVRIYDGSFIDWSNRRELPVER